MSVPEQQLSLPLFDPQPAEPRPEPAAARDTTPSRPEPPAVDEAPIAPGLLTTSETAALLHVHPRTVQRLVERGQLEAVHLGTAVRFDPGDVAALTEREKQRAAAAPTALADRVRASRGARVSFAERLRSRQHEPTERQLAWEARDLALMRSSRLDLLFGPDSDAVGFADDLVSALGGVDTNLDEASFELHEAMTAFEHATLCLVNFNRMAHVEIARVGSLRWLALASGLIRLVRSRRAIEPQ